MALASGGASARPNCRPALPLAWLCLLLLESQPLRFRLSCAAGVGVQSLPLLGEAEAALEVALPPAHPVAAVVGWLKALLT